jgi:hypothetical protein
MRREVLIGSLLIVVGLVVSIIVYFAVRIQIDILDVARADLRSSINNLAILLILLSVACLFLGTVGGYLIGKYRHV